MWIVDRGEQVLAVMHKRGLTWAKLAERFKCNRHALCQWQQGRIEIPNELANDVLKFLNMKPGPSVCDVLSDVAVQRMTMSVRFDRRRALFREDLTVITPAEADQIRANMTRLGLTQAEVSRQMKRKSTTVANWLRGRHGLAISDRKRLLEIVCMGEKIGVGHAGLCETE